MSEKVADRHVSDAIARTVARLSDGVGQAPFILGYGLAVLGLAALYAHAGAYDTDILGAAHRVGLWLTVHALGVSQTVIAFRLLGRLPVLARAAVAVFLACALMTLQIHALKFTPLIPHAPDPLLAFFFFILQGAAPISAGVAAVEAWRARSAQRSGRERKERDEALSAQAAWPAEQTAWVKASDHYLEVRLTTGRTLFVRGRMRDAVRKLAAVDGLQVHRSWWVARASVLRAETRGRDRILHLKDGAIAPVGRSRAPILKDAGWL